MHYFGAPDMHYHGLHLLLAHAAATAPLLAALAVASICALAVRLARR